MGKCGKGTGSFGAPPVLAHPGPELRVVRLSGLAAHSAASWAWRAMVGWR